MLTFNKLIHARSIVMHQIQPYRTKSFNTFLLGCVREYKFMNTRITNYVVHPSFVTLTFRSDILNAINKFPTLRVRQLRPHFVMNNVAKLLDKVPPQKSDNFINFVHDSFINYPLLATRISYSRCLPLG